MSLRDLILSAPDLKREPVEVPEWVDPDGKPVTVYVGMMSGVDRAAWSDAAFDADGNVVKQNLRARLLVHCLVDETGTPIFTEGDVEALERKNGAVLTRLFDAAKKLNGIGADAVEDAEKNSPGAASDSSG